ncbi:MAG TPA: S8 family serine peptidase [Ramlibacter sp.]|nr:S8 family serine peptidase [Ramlibacter sp.]
MIRALLLAFLAAWWAVPAAAAEGAAQPPQQVLVLLNMPASHFRPDGFYSGGYSDSAGRSARRRAAAALAQSYGLHMATDWPMPALGLDCYVMDVPASLRPAEVAQRLSLEPNVVWAQTMNVFRALGHDDPLFDQQAAAREWHLAQLHEWATGRGVRVAVVDSAIQADHPDLAQQVADRLNLVAERADSAELHGTAVAGIIAARADNHVGIAGVAPLARILALRACWQAAAGETLCTSLSLAQALSAAIERNAAIINLSLGGPPDRLIQRLVESALAHGIVVVAAVNRMGPDAGFPAALPGVIAVSDGAPSQGMRAVGAPGTDILTTLPGSRWGMVSGASYAAAHVSGLMALMLDARSRDPAFNGKARALTVADLVSGADGRIDACASLAHSSPSCGCRCGPAGGPDSLARR